jgi:type IV pilus assembly protein PilA
MLHALRRRVGDERGFTLIELLVVILIIGILAAIAIPSFLSQKDKASDASAKSYVRNLQTAEETYFTDNNAYAPNVAALVAIEPTLSDYPTGNAADVSASTTGGNDFTVSAKSKGATAVVYTITRTNTGSTARTCAPTGKGGCTTSGNW